MAIPPTRSSGDSGHIQDHNDIGTELAARLPLSGGTLTGSLSGTSATFTGNVSGATPTQNSHLTTKSYVDTALETAGSGAFATATVRATYAFPAPTGGIPSIVDAASSGFITVTFPSGRFTQTPVVFCQTVTGVSTSQGPSSAYASFAVYSVSTTEASMYIQNVGPGQAISGGGPIRAAAVDVQAIQMSEGNSYG